MTQILLQIMPKVFLVCWNSWVCKVSFLDLFGRFSKGHVETIIAVVWSCKLVQALWCCGDLYDNFPFWGEKCGLLLTTHNAQKIICICAMSLQGTALRGSFLLLMRHPWGFLWKRKRNEQSGKSNQNMQVEQARPSGPLSARSAFQLQTHFSWTAVSSMVKLIESAIEFQIPVTFQAQNRTRVGFLAARNTGRRTDLVRMRALGAKWVMGRTESKSIAI